jgi:hypothetical protein
VAAGLGVIDGAQPRFARHPARARAAARAIERLQSAAEVLRSHPDYVAPAAFAEGMRRRSTRVGCSRWMSSTADEQLPAHPRGWRRA